MRLLEDEDPDPGSPRLSAGLVARDKPVWCPDMAIVDDDDDDDAAADDDNARLLDCV